jgi:putative FmdB family regulatory protein
MPLYEYQCTKCKHRFEKIQKFSDPEVKKCPECGAKVERLISAPAVQFKGTGWYVTDYSNKGATTSKPSSDDGASASSSDDSSASKAKPREEKKHAKKKH